MYFTDINECLKGLHNCFNETEICVNLIGGFECQCSTGHARENGVCDGMWYVICDNVWCIVNVCHYIFHYYSWRFYGSQAHPYDYFPTGSIYVDIYSCVTYVVKEVASLQGGSVY